MPQEVAEEDASRLVADPWAAADVVSDVEVLGYVDDVVLALRLPLVEHLDALGSEGQVGRGPARCSNSLAGRTCRLY